MAPMRLGALPARADFQAGATLAALGCLCLWMNRDLRLGSLDDMGPAYLPRLLSLALVGFSVVLLAGAAVGVSNDRTQWRLRPFAAIAAGCLVFAAGLSRLGLFVTILLVVVACAQAKSEQRFNQTIVAAISIAALSTLVFGVLLKLPIPLWPRLPI